MLASVVQLSCTSRQEENLATTEVLVARAARAGAALVATPENTNFLGPHKDKVARAEPLDGPTATRLARLASTHGIHLLIGSLNEKSDDPHRCYNTSVLFGPDGSILGPYRQLHLSDVDVSDEGRFMESDTVIAGEQPVVVSTEIGCIGLSICYDLRFPRLYQALVDQGAEILTVPSAFTLTTGKDHWEPLLRARAIENQCYVLAPGQHGMHDDKGLRHSWGHSLICDPWGHVIAKAPDGPGIALAELDLERVRTVRSGMPVRSHRRL